MCLVRRTGGLSKPLNRFLLGQRRSFYLSGPLLIDPGLVAFAGITLYQVYRKQRQDEMDAIRHANKIKWRATDIVYYGRKYSRRNNSDEIYDHDSYKKALGNGDHQPILIGHWTADEDGKHYIKMLDEDKKEETD